MKTFNTAAGFWILSLSVMLVAGVCRATAPELPPAKPTEAAAATAKAASAAATAAKASTAAEMAAKYAEEMATIESDLVAAQDAAKEAVAKVAELRKQLGEVRGKARTAQWTATYPDGKFGKGNKLGWK